MPETNGCKFSSVSHILYVYPKVTNIMVYNQFTIIYEAIYLADFLDMVQC